MERDHRTRKQRAEALMKLAERGPAFDAFGTFGVSGDLDPKYAADRATSYYRIWSTSWLIPLLEDLVPELRAAKAKARKP